VIDVERPTEAPASLAERRTYRGDDVRRALHAAFLGKCYLCETPIALGTFAIDHRRPKADPRFVHLEHDWTNLFPTCNKFRCNERRQKEYPDGGLLDPGEGVEVRLVQKLDRAISISLRHAGDCAIVFRSARPDDGAGENTAKELDRLHNGTGSGAIDTANSLRAEIVAHVLAIVPDIYHYVMLADSSMADPAERLDHEARVRLLVSRRAPYSMLVRSYFATLDPIRALFD
jgi:hypothetical protein